MKLKKIFLYTSFIFIIFLSTNVNASDNVKIKSIELIDKSVNTTEVSKATFDGLVIDFDLKFISVDDYAKYKVIVENSESKDYKISVDSNFSNSKYITYEYEKTDSLKANSDTEFYVTVSYKNEVSDSDFSNGKYNEKNSAVLKLSTDSISNPLTSNDMIMIIIGLLVVSVIFFVLFKNKKVNVLVLLGLLSIPLFVKAVDSLKITINSNVSIEKGYYVGYQILNYIKASESSDYDLSQANFIRIAYLGSVSEENKYLYYGGAIYRGKKLYAPGETVVFDSDSAVVYALSNCHDFNEGVSTYGLGGGDEVCETVEKTKVDFKFQYNKSDMEGYGYKYNDDDNTIMKFSDATDNWQDNGKIIPNEGSTFTMPDHDVIFTYYSY